MLIADEYESGTVSKWVSAHTFKTLTVDKAKVKPTKEQSAAWSLLFTQALEAKLNETKITESDGDLESDDNGNVDKEITPNKRRNPVRGQKPPSPDTHAAEVTQGPGDFMKMIQSALEDVTSTFTCSGQNDAQSKYGRLTNNIDAVAKDVSGACKNLSCLTSDVSYTPSKSKKQKRKKPDNVVWSLPNMHQNYN
jgi:hypothetical protein